MKYEEGLKRVRFAGANHDGRILYRDNKNLYVLILCTHCGSLCFVYARRFNESGIGYCDRACQIREVKSTANATHKRCSKCGEWKPHSDFFTIKKVSNQHCGLSAKCRNCNSEYDTTPTRRKAMRVQNVRRRSTLSGNLNHRISSAIGKALKSHKAGRHWETIVGYTLQELMDHLESKFRPGMTWANIGQWHIDHVKPLALFEFKGPDDPQFKEAWALDNLQPLWASENMSKGTKYKDSIMSQVI